MPLLGVFPDCQDTSQGCSCNRCAAVSLQHWLLAPQRHEVPQCHAGTAPAQARHAVKQRRQHNKYVSTRAAMRSLHTANARLPHYCPCIIITWNWKMQLWCSGPLSCSPNSSTIGAPLLCFSCNNCWYVQLRRLSTWAVMACRTVNHSQRYHGLKHQHTTI